MFQYPIKKKKITATTTSKFDQNVSLFRHSVDIGKHNDFFYNKKKTTIESQSFILCLWIIFHNHWNKYTLFFIVKSTYNPVFWEMQKDLLPLFFLNLFFFFLVQKKREAVSLKPPPSCSAVVNFSVQTIESRRFDAGRDSSGGSARQKTKTLPGTHWLKSGSEWALGQLTTKSFCADKIRSLEFVVSLTFHCHVWNTWRAEIPHDEFHCWLLEVTLAEFKMEHELGIWKCLRRLFTCVVCLWWQITLYL